MIISLYALIFTNPIVFAKLVILICVSVVLAVTIHECSHAFIAKVMGDSTGQNQNRLTLNPLRHIDPIGAVMLLMVGFGWGKPVPVDVRNLSLGNIGISIVALAGPVSNISLALLMSVPFHLGLVTWSSPYSLDPSLIMTGGMRGSLSQFFSLAIFLNVLLAVFNLIPVPPLDGSKIVEGVVPSKFYYWYRILERYGPFLLIGIIMFDIAFKFGVLWMVVGYPVNFLIDVIVAR